MRAMILAAGRGERLRPLTDRLPKPLVEAGGKPLIVRHLERLAAVGIGEVVINLAHLGEQIAGRLGDGSAWGLRIDYSREPEPLETAGGVAWARELLGEAPFLSINGDIHMECDFAPLVGAAWPVDRLAHLVLVPNPAHNPRGDFTLERGHAGNEGSPRYTYSGLSVLSPALFTGIERGAKAPLAPLLRAAAAKGRVSAEFFEGLWCDVGTLERLAWLDTLLRNRT